MGAKKEFPCIGCGICCTKVGEHFKNYDVYPKYLQKTLDDFPYQVSEDGTCDQLTDKGLCGVYKDRPLACNMEKLYDENKEEIGLEREHFYFNLTVGCLTLMIDNGKPELQDKLLEIIE